MAVGIVGIVVNLTNVDVFKIGLHLAAEMRPVDSIKDIAVSYLTKDINDRVSPLPAGDIRILTGQDLVRAFANVGACTRKERSTCRGLSSIFEVLKIDFRTLWFFCHTYNAVHMYSRGFAYIFKSDRYLIWVRSSKQEYWVAQAQPSSLIQSKLIDRGIYGFLGLLSIKPSFMHGASGGVSSANHFAPLAVRNPSVNDYGEKCEGGHQKRKSLVPLFIACIVCIFSSLYGVRNMYFSDHPGGYFILWFLGLYGFGYCFGLFLYGLADTADSSQQTACEDSESGDFFWHGNTVTQKLLTTPYFCNTLIAIGRANMANVLSFDKQVAIISALAEGSSIRAIERMTGIHRDTIMCLT